MLFLSCFYNFIIHYIFYFAIYILHFVKNIFDKQKRGWEKSPSLSIVFGLSSKMQWLSGVYYADFISFYSPTQLCGGGTTKSNSNELPISVPLSFFNNPKLTNLVSCMHYMLPGFDHQLLQLNPNLALFGINHLHQKHLLHSPDHLIHGQ